MLHFNLRSFVNYTPNNCYTTLAHAVKRTANRLPKVKQQTEEGAAYISCKRKELNLIRPASKDAKFGTIPLASKGWLHYKSKADYFTIHPTVSAEELQAAMQSVAEFCEINKLQFDNKLLDNLEENLNIKQFTEIQQQGMPKIAAGHHVLLAAETGCGKTLAYMLPLMQQILKIKQMPEERKMNTPLTLIITPGRELAAQIANVAEQLSANLNVKVKSLLGGNTKRLMMNPEFEDVDILVATIGALSKLVTTGIYRVQQVRHIVLDEADTLLDDSFADKLQYLLKRFPLHNNHAPDEQILGTQLILASATMPTNVDERLRNLIDIETLHQVSSTRLHQLLPHVEQRFRRMSKADRPMNVLSIVKTELARKRPLIIFSNKSATCDYVSLFLNNNGVHCLNLNGDMLMKIRLGRFEEYQNGRCDVLSTTDIASRGLDTCRTRHVVNFDFPMHMADYIHRCGRIGRVSNLEQKAFVTNFISSRREISLVQHIEHAARTQSLLPNVNANIKNLINQRIMAEVQQANATVNSNKHEDEIF